MRSTVVCGVDRSTHSRAAARLAIALARDLRHRIELVHVIERATGPLSRGSIASLRAALEEELELDGRGIQLRTGSVPRTLTALSQEASLLVIGSRGQGAGRPAPLGAVCRTLSADPPCALLVVPPATAAADEPPRGDTTIVCGVGDERDAAPALAAAKLASALGLDLTLAHAVPSRHAARSTADAGESEREHALRMLERIARSIATNSSCDMESRVLDGPPGPQLDHLGAAQGAAMLAVGAPERDLLTGALAGSPSRYLVRHGARPVLICPRLASATALRARRVSSRRSRDRGMIHPS